MNSVLDFTPEKLKRALIVNDKAWIVNDYEDFVRSAYSCGEAYLLTKYTAEELRESGATTYKMKNADIGFALKPVDDGGIDIILFHNSSKAFLGTHLMKYVMEYAILKGGNRFDYYETPKLKHMYEKLEGFVEYERYKFDRMYASDDFDYEKYGEPDVVFVKKS